MSTLTNSISNLESGQSSIKRKIEAELDKKASIVEMRIKIEKKGEKLMEQIEKLNKEVIRIQANINADDSKIVELGASINELNAETDQIKQNLREQKNQLISANNVETDLWDDLSTQITKLEGKVEKLDVNSKLDEFKTLYEGRLTILERSKRQDSTGGKIREDKIETKTRTSNALQTTVDSLQEELRQLQGVVGKQKDQTTSSKDKITNIETKILAMDEIVKAFPADQVRQLKVETEQRTLEGRVEPRISSVEGTLEDIEAAVTELSNKYRNDQANNMANNIDLDGRIKEQVREVDSIKVSLADLKSQTEILNGNNENVISESQISALRSKLTEFETNQNGIHSELMKLIRTTKSAKEQNDLYEEKNNLELEEINRQVRLLQSGGTTNIAASKNNNDLY